MSLDTRQLEDDLRRGTFWGAFVEDSKGIGDRLGMEVEFTPTDPDSGRVLLPRPEADSGVVSFLREHGQVEGWSELLMPGLPRFSTPQGGTLSFEPGGQLEYSSAQHRTVDALTQELDRVVDPLFRRGEERGIAFKTWGIDPQNPVEDAPLALNTPRYRRMAHHYDRIGPAGKRMMRQTAALHVNLDWGSDPVARWNVANAMVPSLTAIFANSPRYMSTDSGHRSFRAHQWRNLDPSRTGVFGRSDDPCRQYLRFGLDAGAFLLGDEGAATQSFESWLESGRVNLDDWHVHLTTLFPEIRPRGYLEVRAIDALPPHLYAIPLVLLVGILYDNEALREAATLLPEPTHDSLLQAGRTGLADEVLFGTVRDLVGIALAGARRIPEIVGGYTVERAEEFFQEVTLAGLDPGEVETKSVGSLPSMP